MAAGRKKAPVVPCGAFLVAFTMASFERNDMCV